MQAFFYRHGYVVVINSDEAAAKDRADSIAEAEYADHRFEKPTLLGAATLPHDGVVAVWDKKPRDVEKAQRDYAEDIVERLGVVIGEMAEGLNPGTGIRWTPRQVADRVRKELTNWSSLDTAFNHGYARHVQGTIRYDVDADLMDCSCGNMTSTDGFIAIDENGIDCEPDEHWGGAYRCQNCGATITIPKLDEEENEQRYTNYYVHCKTQWTDQWSCQCNDECPVCGHEIEPYASAEGDGEPELLLSLVDPQTWLPEDGLPDGFTSVEELDGWPS